jgi:hypothetical protein
LVSGIDFFYAFQNAGTEKTAASAAAVFSVAGFLRLESSFSGIARDSFLQGPVYLFSVQKTNRNLFGFAIK